ncbi:BlaI/MecI/CopY family transcriptional regulator [Candidatus Peregrinibacteria bacterium]|nr:BlaI/MecI/CopY family transcriptional regulator [Candidatus Peregrinibacteria bacterium]
MDAPQKVISALRSIGLNDKEVHLYVEMLTIGAQPASVLARKINLPRSSTQFLAESLVAKGIVSKHHKQRITLYQPIQAEDLMRMLEKEKTEMMNNFEEKEKQLLFAVSELKKLKKHEFSKPKLSFYEGTQGIKMVYEDTLSAKEPVRALANFEERLKFLPDYFKEYYKRRKKAGVYMMAIYPDTPFGKGRKAADPECYRESQIIDHKKYLWEPEIQIYDNKVTIASGRNRIGTIIEDAEIAQAMKVLFDLAWEGIKKRGKNLR